MFEIRFFTFYVQILSFATLHSECRLLSVYTALAGNVIIRRRGVSTTAVPVQTRNTYRYCTVVGVKLVAEIRVYTTCSVYLLDRTYTDVADSRLTTDQH